MTKYRELKARCPNCGAMHADLHMSSTFSVSLRSEVWSDGIQGTSARNTYGLPRHSWAKTSLAICQCQSIFRFTDHVVKGSRPVEAADNTSKASILGADDAYNWLMDVNTAIPRDQEVEIRLAKFWLDNSRILGLEGHNSANKRGDWEAIDKGNVSRLLEVVSKPSKIRRIVKFILPERRPDLLDSSRRMFISQAQRLLGEFQAAKATLAGLEDDFRRQWRDSLMHREDPYPASEEDKVARIVEQLRRMCDASDPAVALLYQWETSREEVRHKLRRQVVGE